ncbi:MAG: alpha/beta fold hydrolase [Syntrophales bacterium]|nr:alpha/beta fold hydrolase [Syntrophales bacterium]
MLPGKRIIWLISLVVFMVVAMATAADVKIGVVMLHGKAAYPDHPAIAGLAGMMQRNGFIVTSPEMPYSKGRKYDKSYEDTLGEVDAAVDALKKQGAQKIFIAGHSLGANVALGYAARFPVAGVLAIAPGHAPESANFRSVVGDSVERAKKMVKEGKGDEWAFFTDTNQGKETEIRITARNYLSWFDPGSNAVMPTNAAGLKPGTALLWVVGTHDGIYKRGAAYVFDKAPANPRNRYVIVSADHMNTPAIASDDIIEWLKLFQ